MTDTRERQRVEEKRRRVVERARKGEEEMRKGSCTERGLLKGVRRKDGEARQSVLEQDAGSVARGRVGEIGWLRDPSETRLEQIVVVAILSF